MATLLYQSYEEKLLLRLLAESFNCFRKGNKVGNISGLIRKIATGDLIIVPRYEIEDNGDCAYYINLHDHVVVRAAELAERQD
jgi:hypothetical protein